MSDIKAIVPFKPFKISLTVQLCEVNVYQKFDLAFNKLTRTLIILTFRVILLESFLSFLGLGVQEPLTSWGVLLNEGAAELEANPRTLIVPAVFMTVTLFCFNFIGDGLRDALDPKER